MSATTSPSRVLQYALGDIKNELETTRAMLAAAPVEHYEWKPHDKSFSLGHLVVHIKELLWWGITTLKDSEHDFGQPFPPRQLPESREALLDSFDEGVEALLALVESATEETLEEPWTLRNGDVVFFTDSKGNVFRKWCTSHLAHHRGQLSVYLRLLDVPVPPSYGPTADS